MTISSKDNFIIVTVINARTVNEKDSVRVSKSSFNMRIIHNFLFRVGSS